MYKTYDFGDAQWITAPTLSLDATKKSVFGIEAEFTGSGGLVFGANDERLYDKRRNIQNVAGENWISYVLDLTELPGKLIITRVGYAESDCKDIPFAEVPLVDMDDASKAVITKENQFGRHRLTVHVAGNQALCYVNGQLVDGEYRASEFHPNNRELRGRQLNPMSDNDIMTFPRLHQIGLIGEATFEKLQVFDLRKPSAQLFLVEGTACLDFVDQLKDPSHGGIIRLKHEVEIRKKVVAAKALLTSRGTYHAVVNGMALNVDGTLSGGRSKDYFTPGASQFDKHLFCHEYDLMQHLKEGHNTLDFSLGSGWWSDAQTYRLCFYNLFDNCPALLAKIQLTYEDGTTAEIVSNPTWLATTDGPIRYASHFHGETYDARLEDEPANWQQAIVKKPVPIENEDGFFTFPPVNETEPALIEHLGNPVGEALVITAKSMAEPRPGVYIYDMGQNIAGVPRIKIKAKRGTKITLRFAEVLYPGLSKYGDLQGFLMTENLRDADCTDIYIAKGDPEGEVVFPQFTFHGYRYLELTGIDEAPKLEDVEGVVLSSMMALTSDFTCSDELVNRLSQNIIWSQRGNFLSIPTDCPQRNERMAWLGDIQVFAGTSVYHADTREFLTRFMISVRDNQSEAGRFPNTAPVDCSSGGILWESAGIIVPWEVYMQYGDEQILRDNYEAMLAYIGYLRRNSTDHLLHESVGFLGDWLAYDMSTDNQLLWNAMYAYVVKLVGKIAAVLGDAQTATEFEQLHQLIKATWNQHFVDPATGKTRNLQGEINDTQTSYALPIYYEVYDNLKQGAKLLHEKTVELGYILSTGFVGTQCICAALSDHGYEETAYRLLTQTKYPSWLYSVSQGATTIWERWNSQTLEDGFGDVNEMNSFNHYSLGAVGAWLYSRILGIRSGNAGGYKSFIFQPQISTLKWAKGWYESADGKIESSWQVEEDGKIVVNLVVPEGVTAQVNLPGYEMTVTAGSHEFML